MTATQALPSTVQAPVRQSWAPLAVLMTGTFMFVLDFFILNVALPSIQHGLHAPVSGLQWTVDAYTLVVASFLMLAGSTGDRIGRRRTFQVGLATFTPGAALCSLAPGHGWPSESAGVCSRWPRCWPSLARWCG